MASSSSREPRSSSLTDRASVRGVKPGRGNKKRGGAKAPRGAPGHGAPGGWRRAFTLAGKVVLAVALGVGAAYGIHEGRTWALTSPTFALEMLEVSGHGRATEEQLVRLSGLRQGDNLFALDVSEIEKTVEAHPWVAEARIARRFPRRVAIEVVEHEPVVLVALGHLYYADARGEVVKRYAPGEREQLPVVTGLTREAVETDDPGARARLLEAIGFAAAYRGAFGERAPRLSEIHLDPALGLSFTVDGDEATVVMGRPPWERRLERLASVRAALVERGVRASRIVLGGERRPDRVVARLEARPAEESGKGASRASPVSR